MVSLRLRLVKTYELVLEALADPTRRAVFDLLRQGPRSVAELAAEMPVSRPAVSQHLKVLKGARLVTAHPEGRRTIYRIDPTGLSALETYLQTFWGDVLGAFKETAERGLDPGEIDES